MISDKTIDEIRNFVQERDWLQFNTPAALARSITIEASELLECYQWSDEARDNDIEHVREELADVLTYCIMMADSIHADLDEIVLDKLHKSRQKYPVPAVKGSLSNYNKLHDSARNNS